MGHKPNMTGKDGQINDIRHLKDQIEIPLDQMLLIDRRTMTEFMDADVITEELNLNLQTN